MISPCCLFVFLFLWCFYWRIHGKAVNLHIIKIVMKMKKMMFVLVCLLLVCGCKQGNNQTVVTQNDANDTAKVVLKYAKGFSVEYGNGYKLVTIADPQKEDAKEYRFALVPRGEKPVGLPEGCTVIETPVRGVICMTALQLSSFIKLEALDHIVGINTSRRLENKEMAQRIKDGKTVKIGKEGNFDEELIIASNPDVIFISLSKRGGFEKMEEVGLPLVPYLGYQETDPLAQAEWIKFVGMFIGETAKANELFNGIEKRYAEAKQLVDNVEKGKETPRIVYGMMHGANWYAMGGESYFAHLFRDAGIDYFLKDDNRSGGVNIDFEQVYAQAQQCEYWIIQNKNKEEMTYEGMKKQDPRYADFMAWKNKHVICCETFQTPVNELAPMEPDLVLKDIIHAVHPDVLKDYTPKYYRLIEP